jgi:type I restriction enzyme S subunit
MSGRKATTDIKPGHTTLAVGNPNTKCPKGWIWTPLDKVARMATGHTPSRRKPNYWGGEIPWISVRDARPYHGKTIYETNENINPLGLKNSAAVLLPKGTVCLSRTGSIGYSILLGKEMATSQGFVNWICTEKLLPKYLQLLFVAENTFLHSISEGVAHTTIYFPEAKAFHICLPPLTEQQAIVAKIEELLSELENGKQQLLIAQQQLKVYRESLMKWAFEGKLTKSWREAKTGLPSAKDLQVQIEIGKNTFYQNQLKEWEHNLKIWIDKGQIGKKPSKPKALTNPDKPNVEQNEKKWNIPKNWIWSQMGTLCFVTKLAGFEYTDYVKYDDNGDLPVLKAENVGPLGFKKTLFSKVKTESIKMLTRSRLFGGELIIVFVGAGTGNVAMVPFNHKYFLGPNIGMARPYFNINSKYLELFYHSIFGKNFMLSAVKAVAQPSLSMGTIRQTPIAFPSIEEQDKIVEELGSKLTVCDKTEETISQSLQQAETLKQSILKKAFDGKLV